MNKIKNFLKKIDYQLVGFSNQKETNPQYLNYIDKNIGDLYTIEQYNNKKNFINTLNKTQKKEYDINYKIRISIIISAWQSQDFIEETLDYINNNTRLPDIVIIGVDGCDKTKNTILSILKNKKYKFKIVVYFSKYNVGTFTIRNNLNDLSFNEYGCDTVVNVDSDDLIHQEYIHAFQECIIENPNNIICPSMFLNFISHTGEKHSIENYEVGVNGYSKKTWEKVGYLLPLRGYSDREWFYRSYKLGILGIKNKSMVYFRRMHKNQITANKSYYENNQKIDCFNLACSKLVIHPKIEKIILEKIYE